MECVFSFSCFIRTILCRKRKAEIHQEVQECDSELVLTSQRMPDYAHTRGENGSKVILLRLEKKRCINKKS